MTTTTQPPAIQPRRMGFELSPTMQKYWFGGNPLITTFFYALSATFPDGERYFIHSVRHYQDRVTDPQLRQRIRGFIGQEAHHGNAHEAFNEAVQKMGLPVDELVRRISAHLEFLKRRFSPARQLASTAAMEHITATFAERVLAHPEHDRGMDPVFRQMLVWHAVEEIEHKSVAFDVYRDQVDDESLRRRVMALAIVIFFCRIAWYQFLLLRADRCWPTPRHWGQAFAYFWGRGGFMRTSVRALARYFRRGFHPDDIDQRALVENWQARYPEVAALQAN